MQHVAIDLGGSKSQICVRSESAETEAVNAFAPTRHWAPFPEARRLDCVPPTDVHHCVTNANGRLRQFVALISRIDDSRRLQARPIKGARGGRLCLIGGPLHGRGEVRPELLAEHDQAG